MPKLVRFDINNFKSLAAFSLQLASKTPLTCLVGLNGSGKSTVLQAFDFVGQLFRGDIAGWLKSRGWKSAEITNWHSSRRSIDVSLVCELDDKKIVEWRASFNVSMLRCTEESLMCGGDVLFHLKDKLLKASGGPYQVGFQYQGSVLSQLDPAFVKKISPDINRFFIFAGGLRSFDMLSPYLLRQRARDGDNIGMGGERLSAFIHSLSQEKRAEINGILQSFYKNVRDFGSRSLRSGWKSLYMVEQFSGSHPLETEAKHINDGALRLLAVLAELEATDTVILFDEIENGFNPAIIELLVGVLSNAKRQVIVTTHSPLILNYLEDLIAMDATVLIYKSPDGLTRATRFFDLPEASKRLPHMTPGEVFLDVDVEKTLQNLSERAVAEDF